MSDPSPIPRLLLGGATASLAFLHLIPAGRPGRSALPIAAAALSSAAFLACTPTLAAATKGAPWFAITAPAAQPLSAPLLTVSQLGAALLLTFPQLMRNHFKQLLGPALASDVRQGGGPIMLFLAFSSAAAACLQAGQRLEPGMWSRTLMYASLLAMATAAAPEGPWWPPQPFRGPALHAALMVLATAALPSALWAACKSWFVCVI